jgi:hypothetical protein
MTAIPPKAVGFEVRQDYGLASTKRTFGLGLVQVGK